MFHLSCRKNIPKSIASIVYREIPSSTLERFANRLEDIPIHESFRLVLSCLCPTYSKGHYHRIHKLNILGKRKRNVFIFIFSVNKYRIINL